MSKLGADWSNPKYGTEKEKPVRFREKLEPRNTNYNETVRANNRRLDKGKPTKKFPHGKVSSQTWHGKTASKKSQTKKRVTKR